MGTTGQCCLLEDGGMRAAWRSWSRSAPLSSLEASGRSVDPPTQDILDIWPPGLQDEEVMVKWEGMEAALEGLFRTAGSSSLQNQKVGGFPGLEEVRVPSLSEAAPVFICLAVCTHLCFMMGAV